MVRKIDRQTDRHADRQIDRKQRDRQIDRQTKKELLGLQSLRMNKSPLAHERPFCQFKTDRQADR